MAVSLSPASVTTPPMVVLLAAIHDCQCHNQGAIGWSLGFTVMMNVLVGFGCFKMRGSGEKPFSYSNTISAGGFGKEESDFCQ